MEHYIIKEHSYGCTNRMKNGYLDDSINSCGDVLYEQFIFYHAGVFYLLEFPRCLSLRSKERRIRDIIKKSLGGNHRVVINNSSIPYNLLYDNLKSMRKNGFFRYKKIQELNFIYKNDFDENYKYLITDIDIADYMVQKQLLKENYFKAKEYLENFHSYELKEKLDILYTSNRHYTAEWSDYYITHTLEELIKVLNKKIKDKQHDRK